MEADLVDQLFNSSEKRLARVLLLLANFRNDGKPEPVLAKISQQTLAEMVGTTRSRVSFFMNRFRKLLQSPEGRPIAEQLGIDPDHSDTFAFRREWPAFVKSEASLRIAIELPFWRWTFALHFIPSMMRDAIYDWIARNRYRWFGCLQDCLLPDPDGSWPT